MIESLDCASATRFLASATRRARSSVLVEGPDPDFGGGVVPGVGFGVATGVENDDKGTGILDGRGFVGIGAAIPGDFCVSEPPELTFFIAASFAAISARFCRMRSFGDN